MRYLEKKLRRMLRANTPITDTTQLPDESLDSAGRRRGHAFSVTAIDKDAKLEKGEGSAWCNCAIAGTVKLGKNTKLVSCTIEKGGTLIVGDNCLLVEVRVCRDVSMIIGDNTQMARCSFKVATSPKIDVQIGKDSLLYEVWISNANNDITIKIGDGSILKNVCLDYTKLSAGNNVCIANINIRNRGWYTKENFALSITLGDDSTFAWWRLVYDDEDDAAYAVSCGTCSLWVKAQHTITCGKNTSIFTDPVIVPDEVVLQDDAVLLQQGPGTSIERSAVDLPKRIHVASGAYYVTVGDVSESKLCFGTLNVGRGGMCLDCRIPGNCMYAKRTLQCSVPEDEIAVLTRGGY